MGVCRPRHPGATGYGGRREDIAVVGAPWLGVPVATLAFPGLVLVYPPIMVFMVHGDAPDERGAGGQRHGAAGHGVPYQHSGR